MAVFIRHSRTGQWYGGYNHWVDESEDAFDFEQAQRAAEWISVVSLANAEVVQGAEIHARPALRPEPPTE